MIAKLRIVNGSYPLGKNRHESLISIIRHMFDLQIRVVDVLFAEEVHL